MQPFLLLRGLGREQRHWGPFPDALRAALPGARVHALDLPGAGTEHARRCPTTIRAIAEDARARWLTRNGHHVTAEPANEPWHLIGISLGGMVAMQWCADHPDDFAGVILVNTSAGDLSPPWRRMDLRVVPDVARALVERDAVRRERIILGMTTRMRDDLDGWAARWAAVQASRPVARINVLRQLLAAARFRAPAALRVPTLVVAGAHDPLADPRCAERLSAHFHGSRLAVHPTAGHDLPLDDPEWLATRIAEWIRPPG